MCCKFRPFFFLVADLILDAKRMKNCDSIGKVTTTRVKKTPHSGLLFLVLVVLFVKCCRHWGSLGGIIGATGRRG